jgi:hypothetical protein
MTNFVRTARISAILLGACTVLAASAVPASAAASDGEKKQETTEKAAPRKVMICTEEYKITGSLLPRKRQCKTREEWIKTTGIDPLTDR